MCEENLIQLKDYIVTYFLESLVLSILSVVNSEQYGEGCRRVFEKSTHWQSRGSGHLKTGYYTILRDNGRKKVKWQITVVMSLKSREAFCPLYQWAVCFYYLHSTFGCYLYHQVLTFQSLINVWFRSYQYNC